MSMIVQNQAMSEEFDSDNEFHKNLQEVLRQEGRMVSVNWMPAPPKGASYPWVGLAVLHKGIDLASRRFSVEINSDGYTLRVKGRNHSVKSDYFDGV